MFEFSKRVLDILIDSGWHQGRCISIYKYNKFKICAFMKGYSLSKEVKAFIKEFGGLTLKYQRQDGLFDSIHFKLCEAVDGVHSGWVFEDYAFRLSDNSLCVIGQAFSNHYTLYMNKDGKVYAGFDDLFYIIGYSGKEAIENICYDTAFNFEEIMKLFKLM